MSEVSARVVLAGTIADVDALGKDITALMTGTGMFLLVCLATFFAWKATKSIVAAFVACMAACALWYVVANAAAFRDGIGEDIAPGRGKGGKAAGAAVVRVDDSGAGGARHGGVL